MPVTEAQCEQWAAPLCTVALHGLVVAELLTSASALHSSLFGELQDYIYALSFFVLLIVTVVAYKLVYSSYPGYTTIEQREGELLLKDGPYCRVCKLSKPPRSKHCFVCGHCILRYDHHCPLIANCVGAGNHHRFYCFLLVETLLCCWAFKISWESVPFTDLPFSQVRHHAIRVFVGAVCMFVGGLCAFHTYLVFTGLTTADLTHWNSPLPKARGPIANLRDFVSGSVDSELARV